MTATGRQARADRGEFAGKVALVTGGSRGIGRATALALARSGAAVVVSYAHDEQAATATVKAIRGDGGTAIASRADIADPSAIAHLFDEVHATFGRLDIFVGNAGLGVFAPLAETSVTDFDRLFSVNARGTFFCLQHAAERVADGGRIVCVSTIGTALNPPGSAAYAGSKAAVEQFCRVLAKEIAPRGITVNVVSPGFTDTAMLVETGCTAPEVAGAILDMTPLARLGQPEDVARAICFLAGPGGSWVNRQNLAADGGIVSR